MQPKWGTRGMAVAPHALAAQSALAILREGGNAIEAMIAAAATIAVVYPHMNSIGGDAFWLVHTPGEAMRALDACGAAAGLATPAWYAAKGCESTIPFRGPLAANTVAGTLSGWGLALEHSRTHLGGRLPLSRLLEDAIHYARHGTAVTHSQSSLTEKKRGELSAQAGFKETFLVDGQSPGLGVLFRQPRLAATLEHLGRHGTEDFYRGDLAQTVAQELEAVGSPLRRADLEAHRARWVEPLELAHREGNLYNMTPPTQGVVSLMILGILDRLDLARFALDSAEYVHHCVEATKLAFQVRDRSVTDPAYMSVDARALLQDDFLADLARRVDPARALPWGAGRGPADTVWMGVCDQAGRTVSFIQSIYHEFGSGVVLPGTGINWQNRGCSFSLQANARNALVPFRKPFHTLNPALARLKDGRTMAYGTMGGDGQPQTQCAVFTRTAVYGLDPQDAISRPRWLLGRTWGQTSDTLKLEARFDPEVVARLQALGHETELLGPWDETMGHAGCIVRAPDGVVRGGWDPRSDGAVAAF